jgi:hypothetical protein
VAFAWLLDRGETPLWFVLLGLALVGAGLSALVGRVLPLADEPVTNAAGGPPTDAVGEALGSSAT